MTIWFHSTTMYPRSRIFQIIPQIPARRESAGSILLAIIAGCIPAKPPTKKPISGAAQTTQGFKRGLHPFIEATKMVTNMPQQVPANPPSMPKRALSTKN